MALPSQPPVQLVLAVVVRQTSVSGVRHSPIGSLLLVVAVAFLLVASALLARVERPPEAQVRLLVQGSPVVVVVLRAQVVPQVRVAQVDLLPPRRVPPESAATVRGTPPARPRAEAEAEVVASSAAAEVDRSRRPDQVDKAAVAPAPSAA